MRRKTKILAWMGGVAATCGILYAFLPVMLSYGIRHLLVTQGFHNIQVETGYPRRNGIRIHRLQFDGKLAGHSIRCSILNTEISYTLEGILQRRLKRVNVADITVGLQATTDIHAARKHAATPPVAALLPGQWLSQLPAEEIHFESIRATWTSHQNLQYRAYFHGHLRPAEAILQGEIRRPQDIEPFLRFSTAVQHDHANLELSTQERKPVLQAVVETGPETRGIRTLSGKINADLGLASTLMKTIASTQINVPMTSGHFQAQWHTQLDSGTPFIPEKIFRTLRVESESTLDAHVEAIPPYAGKSHVLLETKLRLEQGILHWNILPKSRLDSELKVMGGGKKTGIIPIEIRIPGTVHGRIIPTENAIRLEIDKGSLLNIKPLQTAAIKWPSMEVSTKTNVQLRYSNLQQLSIAPLMFSIQTSPIAWGKNHLYQNGFDVELKQAGTNATGWFATGVLRTNGIRLVLDQQELAPADLLAGFTITSKRIETEANLSMAGQAIRVNAQMHHQFGNGNGEARITLKPITFSQSGFQLSKLLAKWPYPIEISGGQVTGAGLLSWKQARTPGDTHLDLSAKKLDMALSNLSGNFNEILFSGLHSNLNLAYNGKIASRKMSTLTLAMVQPGFPVQDINAEFDLPPQTLSARPAIKVRSLTARLLGGNAHLDPFSLSTANEQNRFVVHLEKIALKDIMALEKQEGLSGTGLLNGKLPVTLTTKGIEVHKGMLWAQPPGGIIRYVPDERVSSLAQSNPSVKMLAGALSNFHYNSLDINADYLPDGTLNMNVALKGKNLQWQSGRPVHLNLNLEENIPALLKSLRLGSEIEEQTRKGFKRKP